MSKTKILLVEDERITAEDLKNTLQKMGYQVVGIASSADTFYTCLKSDMPDLVLMDIYLKGNKDGIELATEIKEKYQLPVIFLTAFSDTNILERAKVTEPFGYILKPFQERELHSNIEMALYKHRIEKHILHLNAILKAIRDVNQLIVRAETRKELLEKTCKTLISTNAYSSAWFLIVDQDGNHLDDASAGLNEEFDHFLSRFKGGFRPECIKLLNDEMKSMYTSGNSQFCTECPLYNLSPDKLSIISKIKYQDNLYGYLSVSLLNDKGKDDEESTLLKEISDDLGLALHNIEQQNKKREVEENLKNSEEHLRILINAMPDLVCFKDGQGRWLVANNYAINLFGLQGIDYYGKTDIELAEYNEFYKEAFLQCDASDSVAWESRLPYRADKTVLRPDGSFIIFDSIKIPNFDENGNRKGMIVVERDITERKIAEKELQKLSQVVQQSPESIVVTDKNGTIEYANPATSLISGYSNKELIGQNPRILKSGETTPEEYKIMWDTINSGNEWKCEFHNRKKNGELYWERASISPIKNQQGEITHFLSIKEDITEQKHKDNLQLVLFNISRQVFETDDIHQLFEIVKNELSRLIDTKNFFVAFYHEDTDMLSMEYHVDEQESFTKWPAKKSLTGYVIKHNKPVMLTNNDFQKLLETGEVELVGNDSEIWLGVPLTFDGKPFGAMVVQDYDNPNAFDENDLKLLEFIASQVSLSIQRKKTIMDMKDAFAKADAGDRLKTAFINNISHEIRTPLNGILGFTEMTLNPETSAEEHELFFSVIKKSSKRLLDTINSYMDISLLVSGTLEIIRRPSNLDKLIKEIYTDFSENAEHKNIELTVIKPQTDDPVILNTDIEKLRKILSHLLDNAFKFTLKGTIAFGYEIKESEIEFIVSDTGSGIKPEALNIIFDAFMQADVSSTRGYEGSGLGLTIANGLVKILGGKLRIDTERGKGSVFYFTLPFSENPILITPKIIESPKPQEQIHKQLILVAEDDDSNFKYIEIVLLYAAYNVIRAENGIEAVEICRNHPEISLILMDIKMPVMDGFEATKQIRTFMPSLPIIALTAHVTPEDENKAITSGCNEYVTKPVSKSRLLEIIADSLVAG